MFTTGFPCVRLLWIVACPAFPQPPRVLESTSGTSDQVMVSAIILPFYDVYLHYELIGLTVRFLWMRGTHQCRWPAALRDTTWTYMGQSMAQGE